MQLKKLKRVSGPANLPAQHTWHMQQDSMASQLLAELENLTEVPTLLEEYDGGDMGLGVSGPGTTTTTQKRRITSSRTKRQRRAQLVSVFGSQDEDEGMQQQRQLTNPSGKDEDCVEVDLETLPWLQQSTPRLENSGHGSFHANSAKQTAVCDRDNTAVTGIRPLSAATVPEREQACTYKTQKLRQHTESVLSGSLRFNQSMNAAQAQGGDVCAGLLQLQPGSPALAVNQCDEEDAICDDSEDDFGQKISPRATPHTVQHRTGLRTPVVSPAEHTLGSKQLQQSHSHQRQRQQNGQLASSQPSATAPSTPWHLQRRETQLSRQAPVLAADDAVLQQQPVSKQHTGLMGHEAEGTAEDWMPPKYHQPLHQRSQQKQLPLSASKPLLNGLRHGLATATGACTPAAAMGHGRPIAGGSVLCAATDAANMVHADAPVHSPWWMVLEDFVPVEVLVQEAVNPRDGSVVHINYKSQFKDGTTAGRCASTRTKTKPVNGSCRKKSAGASNTIRAAAAAAAAGSSSGFVTAGAYAAAGGGGSGAKGRKAKKGRGSGSGSGSAKGSGSKRRKKGGGSSGQWRYRGGRKVFIDGSGKQLTGSAAWGRYQQGKTKQ